MKTNSENIDLYARKLSGELSQDELHEFEAWLSESLQNRDDFSAFEKMWNGVDVVKGKQSVNVDSAWNKFVNEVSVESRVQSDERTAKKFNLAPLYAIAAIVVIAVFSWVLVKNITPEAGTRVEITTASLQQKRVDLPDNTKVTLNENTEVTYADDYGHSERRVTLKGEAFFEVTHNTNVPFIVEINDARVQVRGTSFFIDLDSLSGDVTVLVETGVVALFEQGTSDTILLTKGQKGVLHKGDSPKQVSRNTEAENFVAWKTKELVFENMPLKDIVTELENAYLVEIDIDSDELANTTFSQIFLGKTFDEIIQSFGYQDVKVEKKKNGTYVFSKKE